MLNLEGTRNERVVVVIVSYVIGFTTAFIGFSLGDAGKKADTLVPTKIEAPQAVGQTASVFVSYTDGKLEVVKEDMPHVLSVSYDSPFIADGLELSEKMPGVHKEIAHRSLRRDGRFLFFCEVVNDPAQCYPYIYDTVADTTFYVRINEVPFPVSTEVAKAAGWNASQVFSIANYRSTDTERPWLLRSQ